MSTQCNNRITAEAVLKAIEKGAKSPTAVAKLLGYKSGSSSIIKGITKAVPDLKSRLAVSQAKHDADKTPASSAAYPMPDCCPFRKSGGYAQGWAILYAHRDKGIKKADLVAKYQAWSKKPKKNAEFDIHVVLSPKEDGSSHRSAAKAAQFYWIERQNDWFRLHLVPEKK